MPDLIVLTWLVAHSQSDRSQCPGTAWAASHLLLHRRPISKGNVIVLLPCTAPACKVKSKLLSETSETLPAVLACPLWPLSLCACPTPALNHPIPQSPPPSLTGLAFPHPSLPLSTLLPAPGKFFLLASWQTPGHPSVALKCFVSNYSSHTMIFTTLK